MKVFCRSSYHTYKVFKESISILIWIISNNSTVSYIFKVQTNVVVLTIQGICFTHTDLWQVELNLDATLDPYVLREENMQRYPKYLEDKTNFCRDFTSLVANLQSHLRFISSGQCPSLTELPQLKTIPIAVPTTFVIHIHIPCISFYTSIVFLLEIQQISEYTFISREFGFLRLFETMIFDSAFIRDLIAQFCVGLASLFPIWSGVLVVY